MSRIDITQNQLFVPSVGYSVHQLVTNGLYTLALDNSQPTFYRRDGAKILINTIDGPSQIENQKKTEKKMDGGFQIRLGDQLTRTGVPNQGDAFIDKLAQGELLTRHIMFEDHMTQIQNTGMIRKPNTIEYNTNRVEAIQNKLEGVSPHNNESMDAKLNEKFKKLQKTTGKQYRELLVDKKSLIKFNRSLYKEVNRLKRRLATVEGKQREEDVFVKQIDEMKCDIDVFIRYYDGELSDLRSEIRNLPSNAEKVSPPDESDEEDKELMRKYGKLKMRMRAVENEWARNSFGSDRLLENMMAAYYGAPYYRPQTNATPSDCHSSEVERSPQ